MSLNYEGSYEVLHNNQLPDRGLTEQKPVSFRTLFCFSHNNSTTVEPPDKGHIGTSDFVLYREVVLSLEVKNSLAQ